MLKFKLRCLRKGPTCTYTLHVHLSTRFVTIFIAFQIQLIARQQLTSLDDYNGKWRTLILFISDVKLPHGDRRKLPLLYKVPQTFPGTGKPPKYTKRLIDIRGPELVHNKLVHKQYGIQVWYYCDLWILNIEIFNSTFFIYSRKVLAGENSSDFTP